VAGRTRWADEAGDEGSRRYVEVMRQRAAEGADLAGEARLLDAMIARRSRVLDAGCGTGRVAAALYACGHDVTGVDADAVLLAAAVEDHPGPTWVLADLAVLDLPVKGFDAVIAAGNVLAYTAEGTGAAVLARIAGHLAPGGVFVSGFGTDHPYTTDRLDADAAAAGLTLEHRWATWNLRPWYPGADWVVSVHRR
jgi:SAM-dependent methyltransferase